MRRGRRGNVYTGMEWKVERWEAAIYVF